MTARGRNAGDARLARVTDSLIEDVEAQVIESGRSFIATRYVDVEGHDVMDVGIALGHLAENTGLLELYKDSGQQNLYRVVRE